MLYNILKPFMYLFFKIFYKLEIKNKFKFEDNKRLIICSNHTHYLDPILLAISFNRKVHFLAKKELFNNKFVAKILLSLGAIPVDRDNNDLKALKASMNILKDEMVLGIFPEGTRVKEESIENLKNGIGLIAYKCKSDILPIKIEGSYKLFSKLTVDFKNIIEIKNYFYEKKSQSYNKIALDTYRQIYYL